jgi:hypothetical protein
MVPVRERHQFAEAIKTKIIREIASVASEAVIAPVQTQVERRKSCEMGDTPWAN